MTRVLLKVLSGSRGFGTHTETSDHDIKGVYAPSRRNILALDPKIKVIEEKAGEGFLHAVHGQEVPSDLTLYDFRHFFQLLLESNPHVLDIVFSSPPYILEMDEVMKVLMADPTIFLTKKVRETYVGYAISQIRRAQTHRSWLLNPPKVAPTRKDFDLPPIPELKKDQRQACLAWLAKLFISHKSTFIYLDQLPDNLLRDTIMQLPQERLVDLRSVMNIDENFIDLIRREKQYEKEVNNWKSYQEWIKHRNPKRYELEKRCGYDSKNISHCIRLLTQGVEILRDGYLNVHRHDIDREYLLDIKNGLFTFEEVMMMVDELRSSIPVLAKESSLPEQMDLGKMDQLYWEMMDRLHPESSFASSNHDPAYHHEKM